MNYFTTFRHYNSSKQLEMLKLDISIGNEDQMKESANTNNGIKIFKLIRFTVL